MAPKSKEKVFDIRWDNFLGGLCFMTIRIDDYDDLAEISGLLKRPILRDKNKNRLYVLDRTTVYVHVKI